MALVSKNPGDIHVACKEAVVDSLLNNLSARLAGRGEFYEVVHAARPSRALTSEFLLPKPLEERDGDEEASPIQISAHGLDLQLDAAALGHTLQVQLKGSVYVRVFPTEKELAPGGALEQPRFVLRSEVRRDLRGRIREGLEALRTELGLRRGERHPDWPARSEAVRRAAHEALGLPFDTRHDVSDPDSEEDAPPAPGSGAPDAGPGPDSSPSGDGFEDEEGVPAPGRSVPGRASVPDSAVEEMAPPAKWVRLDLDLPGFEFTVESAHADAARATEALNAALAEQLKRWSESEDGPHAGKLWGFRHKARMLPSDLANWDKFLERMRSSSLPIALPAIELRWDIQTAPDPLHADRMSVHVALENWSAPPAHFEEVETAVFGVALKLTLPAHVHRPLTLDRVKPSYRYNRYLSYPALGFNGGVSAQSAGKALELTTGWTPRYVLPRIVPREHPVTRNIAALANPDCLPALQPLLTSYDAWLKAVAAHPVDRGLSGPNAAEQAQREKEKLAGDLDAWGAERAAIACGLAILEESRKHWSSPGAQSDERAIPFEAWVSMNTAMAEVAKRKHYSEWRLFQLAFILASIPAFATRIKAFEHFYTPEVARHANAVTLLYFATGGGKSEAFLGLLVYVLFLDRLRGKHRGVSALMRYPLRLLTLQQARRTFEAMGVAEAVRHKREHPGEPFSLGFWVGNSNTPNWHRDEGYSDVFRVSEQPLDAEATLEANNPAYRSCKERWLKLDGCPFCGVKGKLALRRVAESRDDALGHFCTSSPSKCSWNHRFSEPTPLPFWIVDEDIYDFAPSVLLGTVDKLAALGQSQGTIRKFFGLFGFAPLVDKATDRLDIPDKPEDWRGEPGASKTALFPSYRNGEKRFFDPFPSLLIQDEAHLLDESLGTFSGLFESALEAAFDDLAPLLREQLVCEPNSSARRRIKVIAASATVSEPARQMRNLYQRTLTVQFPHPGPDLYESFYAQPLGPDASAHDAERRAMPEEDVEGRSHWARVYGAVLTNGHRHTVAMASVLGHFHLLITSLYERLRSGDAAQQSSAREELERWVSEGPLAPAHQRVLREADFEDLLTLVDLHRIALTYVTNKKGGDQVIDTENTQFAKLHQAAGLEGQMLESRLLSGAVSAAEIQDIVHQAQRRVKPGEPFPELNETLRSIIATSAISHGVDVEEFNAMFFAGVPSDIAEYIQASSRVGRTHVGFSLLVPVPQRYRDRFVLEVHDVFHRFLERMILPAAVDRWAEKALVRVMPSFFQEYLCGVHAIKLLCEASEDRKAQAPTFREAPQARTHLAQAGAAANVERFMAHALGLHVTPAPEGEPYYRALLKEQLSRYQQDMAQNSHVMGTVLNKFFEIRNKSLRPMTSLRDVDLPGVLHGASGEEGVGRAIPDGALARSMRFIRRGSGADIDA